jgi:hypothetical protein
MEEKKMKFVFIVEKKTHNNILFQLYQRATCCFAQKGWQNNNAPESGWRGLWPASLLDPQDSNNSNKKKVIQKHVLLFQNEAGRIREGSNVKYKWEKWEEDDDQWMIINDWLQEDSEEMKWSDHNNKKKVREGEAVRVRCIHPPPVLLLLVPTTVLPSSFGGGEGGVAGVPIPAILLAIRFFRITARTTGLCGAWFCVGRDHNCNHQTVKQPASSQTADGLAEDD